MKKAAFTIVEVMVALFILSTSIFVLSELQIRSMLRVWQCREDLDRVYVMKKYLYRMYISPQEARKTSQKLDQPSMQLVVEPQGIHKKSVLAPFGKSLQFLKATAQWQRGSTTKMLQLMALARRPASAEEAA